MAHWEGRHTLLWAEPLIGDFSDSSEGVHAGLQGRSLHRGQVRLNDVTILCEAVSSRTATVHDTRLIPHQSIQFDGCAFSCNRKIAHPINLLPSNHTRQHRDKHQWVTPLSIFLSFCRFVPPATAEKYRLSLPDYGYGTNQIVVCSSVDDHGEAVILSEVEGSSLVESDKEVAKLSEPGLKQELWCDGTSSFFCLVLSTFASIINQSVRLSVSNSFSCASRSSWIDETRTDWLKERHFHW